MRLTIYISLIVISLQISSISQNHLNQIIQIDSLFSGNYQKIQIGLLSEQYFERWVDDKWIPENRSQIFYNDSLINLKTQACWNGSNWIFQDSILYRYNKLNLLESYQRRVENIGWKDMITIDYCYDEFNREINRNVHVWDGINNSYNTHRIISLYDDLNSRKEEITQFYQDSNWTNSTRWIYSYNGIFLTNRLLQKWEGSWVNYTSEFFIPDSNNNIIISNEQAWNGVSWDTLNLYTFTYNKHNNILTKLTREKQNGVWIPDSYFSYSYDDKGNLVEHFFGFWVEARFDSTLKVIYEYENGKLIQSAEKQYKENTWTNSIGEQFSYNDDGNLYSKTYVRWENANWKNTVRYILKYKNTVDVDENHTINEFQISQNYPNPFNPSTTLEYSIPKAGHVTIKVFNLLGEEVSTLVNNFKQPGKYTVAFEAASLPSGVYVYRIEAENFEASKKMLLLK